MCVRLARMQNNKPYTISISHLPESEVELKGEISWDHVATFEDASFATLAEKINIDGFRKGNVPKDMAKKHIPDEIVLGEMAERAINSVYPTIIEDEKLDVIGRPNVSITKLARGNAVEFTVVAAIVPTITLPKYSDLAKTITAEEPKEVTEEAIDQVVKNLQEMRAYGHVHGDGETHEHSEPLPEVTDEFAKSFGNFDTVADMRAKIRENLILEASHIARDKRRIGMMEAIIAQTDFDIPKIILESEQSKMLAQIEVDVARSGASLEDYLGHIKKTKEELLEEFKPEAAKRARFQLVLNAIARTENTLPTEAEVEVEAQKLVQMYPGADLNRTRAYADMVLTNEKVFAFLESK